MSESPYRPNRARVRALASRQRAEEMHELYRGDVDGYTRTLREVGLAYGLSTGRVGAIFDRYNLARRTPSASRSDP